VFGEDNFIGEYIKQLKVGGMIVSLFLKSMNTINVMLKILKQVIEHEKDIFLK